MKRIIEGKTYNTDTSTKVARWEYKDQDEYETIATLYKTRGGAFFIVHEWEVKIEGKRGYEDEIKEKVYFEAMSREEVARLIQKQNNLEIIDTSILNEPPEAEEEDKPESTVYVRMPTTLKDRIEILSNAAGISVNSWAIRCFERCAAATAAD